MEPLTIDCMRRIAALAGYQWTDEELHEMAPLVTRSLTLLEPLRVTGGRAPAPSGSPPGGAHG